jgi:hypothetical protein
MHLSSQRLRPIVALIALLTIMASVSACAGASAAEHGAGWPNITLSSQSAQTGHGTMTVTPLSIGPGGARFEVTLPNGYNLADGPLAQLVINRVDWPLRNRTGAPQGQHSSVDIWFSKSGPMIGWARLTLYGEDGQSFVFSWYLPGGGS